jgi:hypothetical protein
MARVNPNRVTAQIEGDFVVFLIGLRVNKPWKVWKWWPVFTAMPKMLRELEARPSEETGFLGHTGLSTKTIVQYWRSFEHLERYARSRDHLHWPAWVEFNRRMRNSRDDVGIWHETFLIRAGEFEAIYSGMPLYGLAKAGRQSAINEATDSARGRLGVKGTARWPEAS